MLHDDTTVDANWRAELAALIAARPHGHTCTNHFRTANAAGVPIWCRTCVSLGECGCGTKVEMRVLARGHGLPFLPSLDCFLELDVAGHPTFVSGVQEYSGVPPTKLDHAAAAQLGAALGWLHGLPAAEIFHASPGEGAVVIHGDLFIKNLIATPTMLLLTDFADSRLGERAEDLLNAIELPFASASGPFMFLRAYATHSNVCATDVNVDNGVERERQRRLQRRRRRGTASPEYEAELDAELARSSDLLREFMRRECPA